MKRQGRLAKRQPELAINLKYKASSGEKVRIAVGSFPVPDSFHERDYGVRVVSDDKVHRLMDSDLVLMLVSTEQGNILRELARERAEPEDVVEALQKIQYSMYDLTPTEDQPDSAVVENLPVDHASYRTGRGY